MPAKERNSNEHAQNHSSPSSYQQMATRANGSQFACSRRQTWIRSATGCCCFLLLLTAVAPAQQVNALEQDSGSAAAGVHAAGADARAAAERHGDLPAARPRAAADHRDRRIRGGSISEPANKTGLTDLYGECGAPAAPRPRPATRWTISSRPAPPRSKPTISPTRPPSRSTA